MIDILQRKGDERINDKLGFVIVHFPSANFFSFFFRRLVDYYVVRQVVDRFQTHTWHFTGT